MTDVDVVVIGAGIAGASAGYELARDHSTCSCWNRSRSPDITRPAGPPPCGARRTKSGPLAGVVQWRAGPFLEAPPDVFVGGAAAEPARMPMLMVAREDQRERIDGFVRESRSEGQRSRCSKVGRYETDVSGAESMTSSWAPSTEDAQRDRRACSPSGVSRRGSSPRRRGPHGRDARVTNDAGGPVTVGGSPPVARS